MLSLCMNCVAIKVERSSLSVSVSARFIALLIPDGIIVKTLTTDVRLRREANSLIINTHYYAWLNIITTLIYTGVFFFI